MTSTEVPASGAGEDTAGAGAAGVDPQRYRGLLYERLAALIEGQIASGVLTVGARAPSVRALARSAGVSIATVNQAYQQLEARGLLEARPRSGYFVAAAARRTLEPPDSPRPRTRRPRSVAGEAIDAILDAMRRPDEVLALGSAVTAFTGRLDARLNRITRQVLREAPRLPNSLAVPPGDPALRRAVAARLSLSGVTVEPDHVVVTSGTMDAIVLALGVLCRPGDTVLVESPTYFGILQAVEHLRLKVVEVANTPGAGIDVDGVATLLGRQRVAAAVLMPNFNNPTGALTPDADKTRLVKLLGAAGVPVIEDDIYGDIAFSGERPRPLASFAVAAGDAAPVVTCGSVSKTIALGYRIGWAVSPELAGELTRAKFCTSVACPGLQQRVLARYFDSGGYERHLRQLRAALAVDRDRYRDAIARSFPPGTRVSDPAGGVVLWVQLPDGCDGAALFRRALDQQIGIAPGIVFSAKADYRQYVRISMGAGWSGAVQNGLERLGELARRVMV
ncbi:MAG: aminotransferase class I/II-fold pyridoxal phosphate-dependent enzyme [Gammaproteobacteria bacterium]|jgi:DNA-binding transcriptional MocR family regulator|nr:aminotransferase class I/II-fold pyridoxal phosphate-dependent enzyme [Gammaproteobacteria bacterium]